MSNHPPQIKLIDTTLREGRQAYPGIDFTLSQSIEIASLLHQLGVDSIEVCHPAVDEEHHMITRAIVDLQLTEVITHARANQSDIDAAYHAGVDWVGIFIGVNEISRATRVQWPIEKIFSCIKESIDYAKSKGLKVRFTVEDSSRTNLSLLLEAYDKAIEAGADCICFSDTVGIIEPHQINKIVVEIKKTFPEVDLEGHFHNDRGLAMANSLAAIDGGINRISCAVNGLGERCGITDTLALAVNLCYKGWRNPLPPKLIQKISDDVALFSNRPVSVSSPITGQYAFLHTAHLHKKAVDRDTISYNWIEPEFIGLQNYG